MREYQDTTRAERPSHAEYIAALRGMDSILTAEHKKNAPQTFNVSSKEGLLQHESAIAVRKTLIQVRSLLDAENRMTPTEIKYGK